MNFKNTLKESYNKEVKKNSSQENTINKAIDSLVKLKNTLPDSPAIDEIIDELKLKKTMIEFYEEKQKNTNWNKEIYINNLKHTEYELETPYTLPAYLILHLYNYNKKIKQLLENVITNSSNKEKISTDVYIERI